MSEETQPSRAPLELRDYLAVLRRRWFVLLLVTVAVCVAGVYRAKRQVPVYSASGQLVVQTEQPNGVPTEARILQSPAVHELALQSDPGAGEVSTENDIDTNVLTVLSENVDAREAADTVNAHMDAYIKYTQQTQAKRYSDAVAAFQPIISALSAQITALNNQIFSTPPALLNPSTSQQRDDLSAQLSTVQGKLQSIQLDALAANGNIVVVAPANEESSPIRPKPTQDALMALGAGLLLAIAIAFLIEYFDDSIKHREDLQRASGSDIPVLGLIPNARSTRPAVISLRSPNSAAAEAYRSLRTAVYFVGIDRGSCFEITSAKSQEGKSQTSANLAVAAARAGNSVILVDGDLRRPAIDQFFGLRNEIGFTSVILGEPIENALQAVPGVDGLRVLTSGPLPPNPSELLASDRCRQVVEMLKAQSTFLLIDTPPVLAVTDAAALASSVDALVLVARARFSARRQIRSAVDVLRQINAPLVGSVLVAAKDSSNGVEGYFPKPAKRRSVRDLLSRSVPADPAGPRRIPVGQQ